MFYASPLVTSIFKGNNFLLSYEQVPSHVLMGIPHSASDLRLSPLGEACLRKDLTTLHGILEKIGYKDDDGVANEVLHIFCTSVKISGFAF